ncbi:hypothetical protein [Candidatus Nitrososphaera evergladensis]|uniref:hypothetical protein n=1 Tax=Candidatus Nitrososphaera evergladensis TaxID=1459637 RepID=UPI0011E5C19C|nr:hypothetical protein [Candidatus Nitrososphaera evergladensis]
MASSSVVQCQYVGPAFIASDRIEPPILAPAHKGVVLGYNITALPLAQGHAGDDNNGKLSHPASAGKTDLSLKITLYDNETQKIIRFLHYNLTITNGDDQKVVLAPTLFYTTADLTLNLHAASENSTDPVVIHAPIEPTIFQAYYPPYLPEHNGTINIDNVLLEKPSTYHIHIDLLGIDSSNCFFLKPNYPPSFDIYWTLTADGKLYSE